MTHSFQGRTAAPTEVAPRVESPAATELPPHSLEAERGMLGSILLDPTAVMASAARQIHGQSALFYDLRHQAIWDAMLALHLADKACDPLSVSRQLRLDGCLTEIGGLPYLLELPDASPSAASFPQFLAIAQECADGREMMREFFGAYQRIKSGKSEAANELRVVQTKLDVIRDRSSKTIHSFPEIQSVQELQGANLSPPVEVISGVLHQGSKMVIGGGSKCYKTWILAHMALSISSGSNWLGHKCAQGRVLYVNFEIQDFFFRNRLQRIAEEKGIDFDSCSLDCWGLRGFNSPIETVIPKVLKMANRRAAEGSPYTCIVIEPIYKALGHRDENKAGDIAELMNELERLAHHCNAAVAFAAHFSKGNQSEKKSIDRMSGSGTFARDPDTILSLTDHESENCFTLDFTLRNFAPKSSVVVEWVYPLHQLRDDLDAGDLKQAKKKTERAPEHKPVGKPEILDELRPHLSNFMGGIGIGDRVTMADAVKMFRSFARLNGSNINNRQAESCLKQMTSEGLIQRGEDGMFSI